MVRINFNELSSQFVHSNTRRPYTHTQSQTESSDVASTGMWWNHHVSLPLRNLRAMFSGGWQSFHELEQPQKNPQLQHAEMRGELGETVSPANLTLDPVRTRYLIAEPLPFLFKWGFCRVTTQKPGSTVSGPVADRSRGTFPDRQASQHPTCHRRQGWPLGHRALALRRACASGTALG